MKEETVVSKSPEETWALAQSLAQDRPRRLVLALHGELGSGKTCFVQGLAMALGIQRAITSPTFTVINEYRGGTPLHHIDLYRLNSPDEALAIGFEDYMEAEGVTAVEWAERAGDLIPPRAIHLYFQAGPDSNERRIRIVRTTEQHTEEEG